MPNGLVSWHRNFFLPNRLLSWHRNFFLFLCVVKNTQPDHYPGTHTNKNTIIIRPKIQHTKTLLSYVPKYNIQKHYYHTSQNTTYKNTIIIRPKIQHTKTLKHQLNKQQHYKITTPYYNYIDFKYYYPYCKSLILNRYGRTTIIT
eukprot:398825_1